LMVPKILVVEDDIAVTNLLIKFLTISGYKNFEAKSAEEAEKILDNEEINIVLTDIRLPGMDGIRFTNKIRKKYDLGVIVMTAYSSEYSYADAIQNGASDLIFKPIRLNELTLRINRVVKEQSLKVERDKMIKDLKRLTIEDSLTGLYNSRYFFQQLEKEIERSDRYLHLLSLIFIDIDKFKRINDTYGHMIGDKVLSLIAKKIESCLRTNDTAYRFAGDEFTIILPETASDKAKVVADRVLAKIVDEPIVVNGKPMPKISVSIGIAEHQRNEELQQFVHRADVTMYWAKGGSGNIVAISSEVHELPKTAIQKNL
jgi:two-component system cell cycle response regulator